MSNLHFVYRYLCVDVWVGVCMIKEISISLLKLCIMDPSCHRRVYKVQMESIASAAKWREAKLIHLDLFFKKYICCLQMQYVSITVFEQPDTHSWPNLCFLASLTFRTGQWFNRFLFCRCCLMMLFFFSRTSQRSRTASRSL